MEISNGTAKENEAHEVGDHDYKVEEIKANLPRLKDPMIDRYLYLYQGFWVPEIALEGVASFQNNFVAQDDDVLLASCPKSGTTWLKALVFTIVNRARFALANSPLNVANPHDLVVLMGHTSDHHFQSTDLENIKPRILSTHMPYSLLPNSIKNSSCKIVYICRNPLDIFVSYWHFIPKLHGENVEPSHLEENFDTFFRGIHAFGPFWDHVLGYWKACLDTGDQKILFIKYEDLKRDPTFSIKKLADFLGFPFSAEEDKLGVIEDIWKFCSIDNLRSFEVNKIGRRSLGASNSVFFRKGEVGDWTNYLTPELADRGKKLVEEKLRGSTLTFDFQSLQV